MLVTSRGTIGQQSTIQDVLEAKKTLAPFLAETPLLRNFQLGKLLNAEVYVKYENHLPTNSFKVRGGINLVSRLNQNGNKQTLITASTGNHAQSIAYASKLFQTKSIVVMPKNANQLKVEATKNYGATIIFHGKDFDDAREFVERLASERNYRYVHSANEPLLISGVATLSLEILEQLPNVDYIFAPVGGGSMASGACIVAKSLNPRTKVIGVQSESAPAAYKSWKKHTLVSDKMQTFAEGLATRVGFYLTQKILQESLHDFILVSDREIKSSMIKMIEATRNLTEAPGAAPLAGALRIKHRIAGKRVVLVLSGGNVSLAQLRELLL
jgi:threonine dehydratase